MMVEEWASSSGRRKIDLQALDFGMGMWSWRMNAGVAAARVVIREKSIHFDGIVEYQ